MVISAGILVSSPSLAGIFKWTDENGKVHFSDTKPEAQGKPGVDVKTIKIHDGINSGLPVIEQLKVIPYTGYEPPLAFNLAKIKMNIENADYQRVKIGQVLTGAGCGKKVKDIFWSDGNGYFSNNSISNTIRNEIKKAGYNTGRSIAAFDEQNQRLSLKVELIAVILNSCTPSNEAKSKNETYVKVKWELYDKLLRENLYDGTSEGSSNNAIHSDSFKSNHQSINSAFAIATRNLLADGEFVKHINTKKLPEPLVKSYAPLSVELVYSIGNSSFSQRLNNLRDSTTTVRNTEGHGSGVVISTDGHILTNAHVVGKDKELIVIYKNREYMAKVIRQEPTRDIALLKIEAPFEFSTSSISKTLPGIGDKLFAIGSPLSETLSHTVTSGILSANRTRHGLEYYQTDTSINPGNSGGPVYNEMGELVAISVSGVVSAGGAGVGINYLIPINDAFASLSIKSRPVQKTAKITVLQPVAAKTDGTKQQGILERVIAFFNRDEEPEANNKKRDGHSDSSSDWNKAYDLYQKAIMAKEKQDFEAAEELLLTAVTLIDHKDVSPDAYRLRDELYFHLPVTRANDLIKANKPSQAKIAMKNTSEYLTDHPKRFEFMSHINKINRTIEYLSLAISSQAKAQLKPVRHFVAEYYFDQGKLPDNVHEMSKLLAEHMGHQLTNRFELVNYKRKDQKFVLVFEDINTAEQHEIVIAIN